MSNSPLTVTEQNIINNFILDNQSRFEEFATGYGGITSDEFFRLTSKLKGYGSQLGIGDED